MPVLKLKPSYKDYIWGGRRLITDYHKGDYRGERLAECWELSCHPDGPAFISTGIEKGKALSYYIGLHGWEVLGSHCRNFAEFPILIKFIDANENLSVQVHPDDQYALKNEGQWGKTEMWYVADCKEGACLYYGFSRKVSREELEKRIRDDTLLEVLNSVEVQKGDVLFIEAGTIHAIGKGTVVAEIQQNSNLTYRVYDYGRKGKDGRKRDLHIEKALEVTKYVPVIRQKSCVPHIAHCKYFTVDKISLDGSRMSCLSGTIGIESFASFLILEGKGTFVCDEESISFVKGDSLFVTAGSGKYEITGICEALVTSV